MVINIGKGKLEHSEHELVALLNKAAFLFFQSRETSSVHLSQGIDIVSSSKLSINLHDQLSLLLQFLSVHQFFPLEVATRIICLLGHLYFLHSRLNDLVFEQNAIFDLFCCLSKSLFSSPVVALVVCTLLV